LATHGARLHYLVRSLRGLVLGPALDRGHRHVGDIVRLFLKGKYLARRDSIACVDVRDVARMHRLALETAAAERKAATWPPQTPCGWSTLPEQCRSDWATPHAGCRAANCRTGS